MKSYTDLEQSKKLAEFLSPESADMMHDKLIVIPFNDGTLTPCWSLAALLNVLPDDCGIDKKDGKYVASYVASGECGTYTSDNPVDACVSMIEYLHELKML